MTRNDVTNWILVNYTATSLYSVIAEYGNYHETNVGRVEWMTLIDGASLQPNCKKEGINVQCSWSGSSRIGILGNNEEDCNTCDSVIGNGTEITNWKLETWKWSSGNTRTYPGISTLGTFGYIFVQ